MLSLLVFVACVENTLAVPETDGLAVGHKLELSCDEMSDFVVEYATDDYAYLRGFAVRDQDVWSWSCVVLQPDVDGVGIWTSCSDSAVNADGDLEVAVPCSLSGETTVRIVWW